jgi:TerC family integral membrane protein
LAARSTSAAEETSAEHQDAPPLACASVSAEDRDVNVPWWIWLLTLAGFGATLAIDLFVIGRRPHEPSMREAAGWVSAYVGLAVIFALGLWFFAGGTPAAQFTAGWITEYSLSVDNLFIFVIIMARFAVPRVYQQKVLMVGIVLALIMRGAFIAAGAALVSQFAWVFYLFGAVLFYTAIRLASHGVGGDTENEYHENAMIRWSRRVLPLSRGYDGAHLHTRGDTGRFMFTPLIVVMIAIGTTDLIFALDSIPAIFGLTKEAYLVFAANVFALMGLRQLYFLLGGLLERLKYLSVGLSVILAFIGVKLVLEALHDNNVPFINGGDPVSWAPHVPIWLSLAVIVLTLLVTTAASLLGTRRDKRSSVMSTSDVQRQDVKPS